LRRLGCRGAAVTEGAIDGGFRRQGDGANARRDAQAGA